MTEFRLGSLSIDGVSVGESSPFPAMRDILHGAMRTQTDEDDGLFIGYGMVSNALPYSLQDRYGDQMESLTLDTIELENDRLHAVFLPSEGARLWSLYDKVEKRDLIHRNVIYKPGNLAVRNAWVAGGVEWNIGRRGHDARTCSPLFAAKLTDGKGNPVLRFYEFSRQHGAVYQMDFILPDGSAFLYARMRIVNPNSHLIPMYWWSNIAVTEFGGDRVIVPADTTFANCYVNDAEHSLTKLPMPFAEGYDCSYPANYPIVKDHFFNIPDSARKYEATVRPDGYGLIHTSTSRLQGRKLFAWGQNQGGLHWQQFLSAPGTPGYIEIQAGLAKTQMECLPMPPNTAWEWLEAYGPVQCDPAAAFGQWDEAKNEVYTQLEQLLPEMEFERFFTETASLSRQPADEVIYRGSGWGALENLRRNSPMTSHLDFGTAGAEQAAWRSLLETGNMPQEIPISWMITDSWFQLLKESVARHSDNWVLWYHLAINEYYRRDYERALTAIKRSLELQENAWGIHVHANILRSSGDLDGAAREMGKALKLFPDESLARETLKTMIEAKTVDLALSTLEELSDKIRQIPMIRFLEASILVQAGNWRKADAILSANGGLTVPDIREGESSLSDLYVAIRLAEAVEAGKPLDHRQIQIPYIFDFRMSVDSKGAPA